MTSVLAQAITMPSGLTSFLPWIAIATFLGLAYMVFMKKDKRILEMLTTSKALLPTFFLVAMALVPSTVMAIFGAFEPVMNFLIQAFLSILIPFVFIAIPVYIVRAFKPEWVE